MKIVLATDHAGFELKEKIKEKLLDKNFEVKDFGALTYDSIDDYVNAKLNIAKNLYKFAINYCMC